MNKSDRKKYTIRGLSVIVITLVIMLGIGLVSNIVSNSFINDEGNTFNAQLGDNILIEKITASEIHYIDSSLINIPLSVPYEVTPSNATNQDVYIISSDNSIVVVNDDNTITALKTGTVTLTLVANDGSNVTTSLQLVIE
ncbi:MAG: Ig-like domain-containing protein [Bacilli bacterium]